MYLFSGQVSWVAQLLVVTASMPPNSSTCLNPYILFTSLPQPRMGVFSQRGSGASKIKFSHVREQAEVCTFSWGLGLELAHHFPLVLLAKAREDRVWELQSHKVKGLYRGRNGELKPFLNSIILYGGGNHSSRFAQKSPSLFSSPLLKYQYHSPSFPKVSQFE